MKLSRKIIVILSVILSLTIFLPSTFEQINANNREELDQIEQEREQDFLNQLLLDIPPITDNPSHIITFVDPSEGAEGIQLDIDGRGFELIRSPYNLPALRIGLHELSFKFVDRFGSTQILEKDIIIIPRPPIINSPTFSDNSISVSGSGLAGSELILILSSGRNIETKETDINSEGLWELDIETENLIEGVYTFTAYTRRYGYASNLAEPITFELGETNRGTFLEQNEGSEIYFRFDEINFDNIMSTISNNSDLVILIAVIFTLGFFSSWILNLLFRNSSEKKVLKVFENKINNNGNNGNHEEKEMTLKERLSKKSEKEPKKVEKEQKKNKKEKEAKKPKKKETKKKKEEKIVTKVDFLKDFKTFDPDHDDGTEKDNIEVKVTSKK
jgi:hypothetical protein